MQKTGRTIQTIATIVTIVMPIGTFIMAIALTGELSSRLSSTILISALFLGLGQLINGILLYSIGKIVEGIGNIAYDIHNMSNINNHGIKVNKGNEKKEEIEEKLPNL